MKLGGAACLLKGNLCPLGIKAGQMICPAGFTAYLFLLRSLTSLITSSATFLGHGM